MYRIAERFGFDVADGAVVHQRSHMQLMAADAHFCDFHLAVQRFRRRHVGCAAVTQAAILRSTSVGMAGQTALFRIAAFIVRAVAGLALIHGPAILGNELAVKGCCRRAGPAGGVRVGSMAATAGLFVGAGRVIRSVTA